MASAPGKTPSAECTVCFDCPLEPPILQCHQGHLLCSYCEPLLSYCPTCRAVLPKGPNRIRNRAMEEVQAVLPSVPCRSAECPRTFRSHTAARKHSQHCDVRSMKLCEFLTGHMNCTEPFPKLAPNTWLAIHIASAHKLPIRYHNRPPETDGLYYGVTKWFPHTGRMIEMHEHPKGTLILDFKAVPGTNLIEIFPAILASKKDSQLVTIELTVASPSRQPLPERSYRAYWSSQRPQHNTKGVMRPALGRKPNDAEDFTDYACVTLRKMESSKVQWFQYRFALKSKSAQ